MNKPEASGAKSLEQILASIRKSLAGEGSDGANGGRPGASTPELALPEPQPFSSTAGEGDGGLSARLAGALGAPANGAAHDDDFTELLASEEESKPAQPRPAPAGKPADARSESNDPLWFLRRQPAGDESKGQPDAAARTEPTEASGPTDDKVTLSRPEVLRASLPPLFGGGEEPSPVPRMAPPDAFRAAPAVNPMAPGKPAPASFFTAKTQPVLPAEPDGARTGFGRILTPAPAPVVPEAPSPGEAAPAAADGAALDTRAGIEAKPEATYANGLAEAHSGEGTPLFLPEPAAMKLAPAAATPQSRTLENVIGELLEPVIRQWLEANLPRLVEEMVRKEVARALPADRNAPTDRDLPKA